MMCIIFLIVLLKLQEVSPYIFFYIFYIFRYSSNALYFSYLL